MTNEQAAMIIQLAAHRAPPLEVYEAMLVLLAAEREACASVLEALDVAFEGSARSWADGVRACRRQGAAAVRARGKP